MLSIEVIYENDIKKMFLEIIRIVFVNKYVLLVIFLCNNN